MNIPNSTMQKKKIVEIIYPSTDHWINKLWYIHVMGKYLVIKNNELLIYATMWMSPQVLCQLKEARHKKSTHRMIPLI